MKKTVTAESFLQAILWCLKFVGCNPLITHRIQYVLFWYHLFGIVLTTFLLVLDMIFSDMDINELAYVVMFLTGTFQVIAKLVVFRFKKRTFVKIIRTVRFFWTADTFPAFGGFFNSFLSVAYTATKLYQCFFTSAILMHLILPTIHKEQAIRVWLPVDREVVESSWLYLIIYNSIEFSFLIYTGIFSILGCDMFFTFTFILGILQFKMLQFGLKHFASNENNCNANKRTVLNSYIKYHKVLLEYIEDIQDFFQYPYLCQISGVAFAICLSAFLLTNKHVVNETNSFNLGAFMICNIIQILLFCSAGQQIQHESTEIATAIYFSGWEEIDDRTLRSTIQFIIARSQKEIQIKAWFLVLSYALFISIMKTSFSFFTLLQNTQI